MFKKSGVFSARVSNTKIVKIKTTGIFFFYPFPHKANIFLRLKNEEEEVEKFVMANTQELAKDKWLCPLSGKFRQFYKVSF